MRRDDGRAVDVVGPGKQHEREVHAAVLSLAPDFRHPRALSTQPFPRAADTGDIPTPSIHGPGTRRFDSLELTTTGVLFVVRYDADGSARRVFGIGGTNAPDDGDAHAIAVRKGRGISVAGILRRTWKFGTLPPITATGLSTQHAVVAHACE